MKEEKKEEKRAETDIKARLEFFQDLRYPPLLAGETALARSFFLVYCQLGENRSLANVCQMCAKKPRHINQLKRWSARYRWPERAAEYDRTCEEKAAKAYSMELAYLKQQGMKASLLYMDKMVKMAEDGVTRTSQVVGGIRKVATVKDIRELIAQFALTTHEEEEKGTLDLLDERLKQFENSEDNGQENEKKEE